jgi:xylulokinase
LSSSHTRGHLYRSILEGIAFEILFEINAVEKSIDSVVKEFIAIGGGAKSNLWLQIFADITGKNVCIPQTNEASALGAAITAAVGSGWFKTFNEAAGAMTGVKKVIIPNKKNHKIYKQLFLTYGKIYPQIKSMQTH